MLLDSNIIIYSAKPEYRALRDFIAVNSPAVSAVSYVEVLGYHRHTEVERMAWEAFFSTSTVLPIDQVVLNRAVALRQMRRMSLGDAIIAATALVHTVTRHAQRE